MSYAVIQPPFDLKLRDMPAPELTRYYQWFFEVMGERINQLAHAVQATPSFENWKADYTPESLDQLGEWLAQQVETRPRTPEERQNIQSWSAFKIEVAVWELTNKTFSLAMDIGMYFGQVLKKNHPFLRWEQPLKDKKFVDYGHPVLMGFGQVPLNPIRIVTTFTYGLVDKTRSSKRLRELYTVWEKMISPD